MDQLAVASQLALAFSAPYVGAFVIGIIVSLFAVFSWSRPAVGILGVTAAYLVDVLYSGPVLPVGISIYAPDLVSLVLGTYAIVRLPNMIFTGTPEQKLWGVFSLVLLGSFGIGLALHKTAAGVDVRPHFHYWVAATYVAQFRFKPEQFRSVLAVFLTGMAALMLVVGYRWLELTFGFGDIESWVEDKDSLRVIAFHPTFGLTMALLACLAAAKLFPKHPGVPMFMSMPLALSVLVLQHRTAWIAFVAAMVFSSVAGRQALKGKSSALKVLLAMGVIIIAAVVAGGGGGRLGKSLGHSVEEVSAERSTFTWRTQSWTELLGDWVHSGPVALAVGRPYGSGWSRWVQDQGKEVDVNPHSNYVYLLLRVGLIGTVGVLGAILLALKQLLTRRQDPVAVFLASALVAQLLAFVSYPGTYGVAFTTGLALAYARLHRKETEEPSTDGGGKAVHPVSGLPLPIRTY